MNLAPPSLRDHYCSLSECEAAYFHQEERAGDGCSVCAGEAVNQNFVAIGKCFGASSKSDDELGECLLNRFFRGTEMQRETVLFLTGVWEIRGESARGFLWYVIACELPIPARLAIGAFVTGDDTFNLWHGHSQPSLKITATNDFTAI